MCGVSIRSSGGQPTSRRSNDRSDGRLYDFLTEQTTRFLYFAWLDPMPGGQYGPGFDPEAAARKLTVMDMHPGASERYGFSYEKFPSYK